MLYSASLELYPSMTTTGNTALRPRACNNTFKPFRFLIAPFSFWSESSFSPSQSVVASMDAHSCKVVSPEGRNEGPYQYSGWSVSLSSHCTSGNEAEVGIRKIQFSSLAGSWWCVMHTTGMQLRYNQNKVECFTVHAFHKKVQRCLVTCTHAAVSSIKKKLCKHN